MELIYTAQKSGFDPDKRYRNPQHFDRPESGVKKVVIIGDWPSVAAAYEKAGADVSVVEVPKAVAVAGMSTEVSDRLIAELASIDIIVESFAAQSLERPEGELGETAGRLFQVLEAVNAGIASLQRERDGEVQKVVDLEQEKADLLKQIESLKAANVDPEVETLKAALDKAGINYRANASKESLQKLVDDLPK